MKISKYLVTILTCHLINSTLGNNLFLSHRTENKKLIDQICTIIKENLKSTNDTQDVVFGNLGGEMWSSTINDFARCVGDENSVLVTDFKTPVTEKSLRKGSMVILTFGHIENDTMISLIEHQHNSTIFHHMSKVICIVNSDILPNQQSQIVDTLLHNGFINIVIVHEANGDVVYKFVESVEGDIMQKRNAQKAGDIFPDKLMNLKGHKYRIAVHPQNERVVIKNNQIRTPMIHFVTDVLGVQNASAQFIMVKDYKELPYYWTNGLMDFTLNTAIDFNEPPHTRLMTYEENGYCAMIPLPSKTALSRIIFGQPFDDLTWIFLVITTITCIIVWCMFRDRGAVDSPWLLAYGIFVMLIGQSVNFTRKNRFVLAILLQLIIFMIFVLSQVYESAITSFMIEPIQENRLKTVNQLLDSNFEIMSDEVFGVAIKDSEEYEVLKSRLNTSFLQLKSRIVSEIERKHYVFISKCSHAKMLVNGHLPNEQRISELYYLLPQAIMSYLEQLEASLYNPFIDRLQYYMNLCFEAGLPYIWKVFMSQDKFDQPTKQCLSSQAYLKLKDIFQVFHILFCGYTISFLVFLVEIFFYDCLKNLKVAYLGRMLRNRVHQISYKAKQPKHPKYRKGALYYIIHRHKKIKRLKPKKLKVRKIFVRPRNFDEEN